MRPIPQPAISVEEVLRECLKTKGEPVKSRLLQLTDDISSAESSYKNAAAAGKLCSLTATNLIGGQDVKEEMSSLYSDKLARKGSSARHHYDSLRLAAPNDRCPYCGHGTVKTLDHYLPKSKYSAYAVTPVNLVPSCSDCNHLKRDEVVHDEAKQPLHPYFDSVEGETWLVAEVCEGSPPVTTFKVERPENWDDVLFERVNEHLNTFGLPALFSSLAGSLQQDSRFSLRMAYKANGAAGVRSFLVDQAESRLRVFKNSWEIASFLGWANSDWFCSEGFRG